MSRTDKNMDKNNTQSPEEQYPKTYFDTFTKIVCAMIIHPNPNHDNYTDLVNTAKSITDKMFESIKK